MRPGRLFRGDGSAIPLALTHKRHDVAQGVCGTALFIAGRYPACSLHGALNRVSQRDAGSQLWRCLNCNIGAEWPAAQVWPSLECVCGGQDGRHDPKCRIGRAG